ncbi:putative NADH-flavin reductase [Rhizobium leguminosarum]|uniref:Putative NADH-flavin reductase n=1 Tax=Rhizobium leguminosarum TaxID=384 RepID=A0A7Z0DY20_RHILE|nr:NAD(P)H-binding protein [Rhizobium leguminosarum]NYJ11326.1 putative NADH-flavin reductase [Rhizobium leguminosarum]
MKVVVLAATGQAGRTVLSELISRSHQVTAVARNPDKLPNSIDRVRDDLSSVDRIAEIIAGADAVVSAFGPPKDDPRFFSDVTYTDQLAGVAERLIAAVRKAGVPRLVVVGGAGSLEFAPGVTVLKSGHWPEALEPIAISHMKAFAALRASDINWTYFSPPMLIDPVCAPASSGSAATVSFLMSRVGAGSPSRTTLSRLSMNSRIPRTSGRASPSVIRGEKGIAARCCRTIGSSLGAAAISSSMPPPSHPPFPPADRPRRDRRRVSA